LKNDTQEAQTDTSSEEQAEETEEIEEV